MTYFVSVTNREEPNKLFVYLVCLYVLTWYLQVGFRSAFLDSIRFEFLLGLFLSVSAFFVYFSSPNRKGVLFVPAFIFLCILFAYTLFSYNFNYSWNIFFNRALKFSMLAFFLSMFIRTPWALKMVVGAFLLAMLKLGQEGFVGWWTGSMMWENQGIMRLWGSNGKYGHPNSLSGMAVGCLPFIYYLYPVVSKLLKWLLILLFIFCAVIIVFTGSRTGYLATLGLGAVFFWKHQGTDRWRYLVLAVLIAGVAIIMAPPAYKERFESIFTLKEKEGASAETRIEIWRDAINVYVAYPFGVGVGAFPLVREEMFGRSQDTHSLYLELLTNLGPVGFAAFLILVYRILWANRQIQAKVQAIQFGDKSFIIAISQSIVAFIYVRLFLGIFGMDTYEIYWWFGVGITSILWGITQENRELPG